MSWTIPEKSMPALPMQKILLLADREQVRHDGAQPMVGMTKAFSLTPVIQRDVTVLVLV
jgi:hypothetical protein